MAEPAENGSGRPQDQGRAHRRRSVPSAATATLLARWQDALRAELRMVIDELERMAPPGITPPAEGEPPALAIRLDDPRRSALVDRGIKVGRELGTSIDPAGPGAGDPTAAPALPPGPPKRRGRVDFG